MKNFNKKIQEKFKEMCATGKLFRVKLSGSDIWDLYINAFTDMNDPIFRDPESSTHNCNHCKNFIRRYGNVVSIDENYNIVSMFDIDIDKDSVFFDSAKVMSKAITTSKVTEVFFETYNELNSLPYESCSKSNTVFRLGTDKNVKQYTKAEAELYGNVVEGEIRKFDHIHLDVEKLFVDTSGLSVESIMGKFRDDKNVFKRAMDEISIDTLKLVKDLINQGSLLDATAHMYKIEQIIPFKEVYDKLSAKRKDTWCWVNSYKLPFAKFRNELIGVLCSELSDGEEINKACQSWNKRVDPANYMKATAPITKKQIEEAKKFVIENGYEASFNRRFATIDDIKVSEIKHINSGKGEIKEVSIFDNVKPVKSQHKRNEFDNVEEVSIDKFMKDILPTCTSVEAYLQNTHDGNLVSLTTANVIDSKPIFKWSNNYSWTFNGNLAGKSQIKAAVKDRGGKVEGCLNVRLHFPNTESDYDLHLIEPGGYEIYYSNRRNNSPCSGQLDLDAQGADGHFPPDQRVENIIYSDLSKMKDGEYKIIVNNYSERDKKYGFTLEVEYDGEVTSFIYDKFIPSSTRVSVCSVMLKNGNFEIVPVIPVSNSNTLTKEIYGLETNNFHKVNLVCLSPNHWDDNNTGNKHYFFMLDNCKSPTSIRSFHNENLIGDLLDHRKVMEVLGTTNMIESTDKQLSGLGFNSTVKDELILKLQGNFKRVIKVKF